MSSEKPKELPQPDLEDAIDLSQSTNQSPDIKKEKDGYNTIAKELQDTRTLKSWEKYDEHDINQAFYRYTGKEIDKVWSSKNAETLRWLQKDLLIELQKTHDPREKLQRIADFKEKLEDSTGSINGENSKQNTQAIERTGEELKKKQETLEDRFKEFGEMLRESQEEMQRGQIERLKEAQDYLKISQNDPTKQYAFLNPEVSRIEGNKLDKEWP